VTEIRFRRCLHPENYFSLGDFFARFSRENPEVAVRVEEITDRGVTDSAAQSPDKLHLIPSYLREDPPDVAIAYGETVALLADADLVAPLDGFLDGPDGLPRDDFVARVLEVSTYRGVLWGLPIEANPYALFCNLDLFEQAGIAALPTNWAELMQASRDLMEDTDGDGRTDRYGYTQCTFQVPLLMWQAGGDLMDAESRRILFDSEEAIRALKYHADIRMFSPPHVEFEYGDVGMKLSIVENLMRRKYAHLNFRIVPLPAGRRRANSFGQSQSATCLVILRSTPEREQAAWRLLRWWADGEGALTWSKLTGFVPVRRSLLADPDYREHVDRLPGLAPFAEQMEAEICHPRPCLPEFARIKWIFANAVHLSREGELSASVDRCREILHQCAQEAQQILDETRPAAVG
jgi:multiple sugar transport system substrate-binding protein